VVETANDSDVQPDAPVFCYLSTPEELFSSILYMAFLEERSVTLGDSTTRLLFLGKGTIKRWVETAPHSFRHLVLTNVLHVNGIQQHFLSQEQVRYRRVLYKSTARRRVTISKGKLHISGFRIASPYTFILYADKPLSSAHFFSPRPADALPIATPHEHLMGLSGKTFGYESGSK